MRPYLDIHLEDYGYISVKGSMNKSWEPPTPYQELRDVSASPLPVPERESRSSARETKLDLDLAGMIQGKSGLIELWCAACRWREDLEATTNSPANLK